MNIYLTGRQTILNDAIAAAPAQKDVLEAELDQLTQAPAYEVSDQGFELALLAWLSSLQPPDQAGQLPSAIQADPALAALGRVSALTAPAATAVYALVVAHKLSLSDIPAIQTAAGSADAFTQLLWAAVRTRLSAAPENRAYLYRDVAVLLPLRFETRFDPVAAGWKMRLRVVPDEPSIRRDKPVPTAVEAGTIRQMWQNIYDSLTVEKAQPPDTWLETPRGLIEWDAACRKLGAGRAAWIAGTFPPVITDGAITINVPPPADPPPDRVAGFPHRLEVWAGFLNDPPVQIDAFDVAIDKLDFDVIGARRLEDDSVVEEKDRWWVSWQTAVDVGMAREIVLPNGRAPNDIRLLYVIGIGDDNPADLFAAHINAGAMSTLSLGTPTNAVDGRAAADLGLSAEDWRRVTERRLQNLAAGAADDLQLSQSLVGLSASLPALPVGPGVRIVDQTLVQALWPALWGHQMRDLWGCVDESDQLAKWALTYLRPEGPLPPIRIAEQPYGLLPTSALSAWRVSTEEGPLAQFENRLRPPLLAMRQFWAGLAATRGTAVGADTQKLLDIISRDAVSASYAYRFFLPVDLWEMLIGSAVSLDTARLDQYIRNTYTPVYRLTGRDPSAPPGYRHTLAAGGYAQLEIPLVVPTTWPYWYFQDAHGNVHLDENGNPLPAMSPQQGLVQILTSLLNLGHKIGLLDESFRKVLPDSLLVRLLIQSCLLSAAAVVQANTGSTQPLLEPLVGSTLNLTVLDSLAQTYTPAAPHNHPAGEVRQAVMRALDLLRKIIAAEPAQSLILDQVDRAFRAVLDTSTHRIDPWIAGFAHRRLEYLRSRPEVRFRLGVYGWVDGPILGKPGPTSGALLHAPSHPQALAAVILRDKYISEALEDPAPPGGRNLWSMQLESRRIRLAEEMAEEVRLGSHIYEVLGRRVEQAFDSVIAVDALRLAYPLRPGQPDRGVVCHGADALNDILQNPAPKVAATPAQRDDLTLLSDALDAYGDLLVAEAVHQVVTRRADIAGAAMDAAAGLTAPPTLDFVETPISGESLNTTVISAIQFVTSVTDADPKGSPTKIADASVAAAVEALLGAANTWTWQSGANSATLADLGLEPIDTVVLSDDLLNAMMRLRLGAAANDPLDGNGSTLHRRARALVRSLGSQQLLLRSIAPLDEDADAAAATKAADQQILAELAARYAVLRNSAQAMVAEMTAAHAANEPAQLAQALFRGLRWGVTPMVTLAEQSALFAALFDNVAPDDADLLPRLVLSAQDSLKKRLDAAPAVGSKDPVSRSIAELAAPEGQIAVLSRVSGATLAAKSQIRTDAADTSLDEDWLAVNAAVRPYMGRLEALQLEAPPQFTAWSTAPDDHWQTAALTNLQARREQPGGGDRRLTLPRFVAAYTPGNLWNAEWLAAGLIDSWGEVIPTIKRTTTAAFGFNAPAARPPQAILLAVPPDLDADFGAELTTPKLIDIVDETRELSHARALDAEQAGIYLAAVPMAMFQGEGSTGVHLDKGTTFPD